VGSPFGFSGQVGSESFLSLVILQGSGTFTCAGHPRMRVKAGDSLFLPASIGEYNVEGSCYALATHV
jgi:mannose-6-phosphate isomerase class I